MAMGWYKKALTRRREAKRAAAEHAVKHPLPDDGPEGAGTSANVSKLARLDDHGADGDEHPALSRTSAAEQGNDASAPAGARLARCVVVLPSHYTFESCAYAGDAVMPVASTLEGQAVSTVSIGGAGADDTTSAGTDVNGCKRM